jgi:hypothetical protein
MEEFDYYMFIDYSENLLGYNILEYSKIKELLPKISKIKHYKDIKQKREYVRSIRKIFEKNKVLDYFLKAKIREIMQTPEIFSDIAEFLRCNSNCLVFISVDNKQYSNFERFVKVIDGASTKIVKESELKKDSKEYKISLVLDNWLNLERLKHEK